MASLLNVTESKPADLSPDKIDRTIFGRVTDGDFEQARRPQPPPELKVPPDIQDFDLRGDAKTVWEKAAAQLHLLVVFDSQYQPAPNIKFRLSGVDYRNALVALEAATDSFLVPVSSRLIFIANDNPQKRTEFESTAAVVIPFAETISAQELHAVTVRLRAPLAIPKLTLDTPPHLILFRDRVTKIRLPEKLLEGMHRPRPEVAVEG